MQTLAPGRELEDDVVNAYVELLKLREMYMWDRFKELKAPAKRFYTAPSFLMYQSEALCTNLNVRTHYTYLS